MKIFNVYLMTVELVNNCQLITVISWTLLDGDFDLNRWFDLYSHHCCGSWVAPLPYIGCAQLYPLSLHSVAMRASMRPARGISRNPPWFAPANVLCWSCWTFLVASGRAFAAVAYVRTTFANNQVSITFLAGRSRVGPIRKISINRMELQAAVLGSRLAHQIALTDIRFSRRIF